LEVSVTGLQKAFDGKPVLKGVNLSIRSGELLAIVGGSGCGKTVLLKLIMGHYPADAGQVLVADHELPPDASGGSPLLDIGHVSEKQLDQIRMHWAIVFQRNALVSGDVFENLAVLPREVKGMKNEAILPLARQALVDVGLDPEMSAQIQELIGATHRAQPAFAASHPGVRRTSIVVTHDTELLRRLRPRIVMLHGGTVLFDGTFDEFVASHDPHVRPYLAQMPGLHLNGATA
jgi:phospholipid/cholesterol/gamma-HCH transport system ATP-binding protein